MLYSTCTCIYMYVDSSMCEDYGGALTHLIYFFAYQGSHRKVANSMYMYVILL